MSHRTRALITAAALFVSAIGANAQQPTPPAGSPGATKPISGQQLPPLPTPFGGKIERNAAESTPYWAPRVVPPKGAPNVLLVMIDDEGYGASSTFGGVIPTPALDRIAAMGLRYTQFHSTALCSPTRAALITGRNHHSMGFGVVAEQSTGYPGYNSLMSRDKATIGKILRDNGYSTSWFGKDHNTPEFQASQAGPFDQWPTGMGFDYFYGFVGGDANQWQPNLFRNTTAIYPYQGHPGWNLMTAMADDAIEYLHRITAINSQQPFFVYYVPGATHAPHHPTPEWIKKASDLHLFDKGWNALRDTIFANQKRLGVIPASAQLTPWPGSLLKRWDKLTAEEQKLFVRQADVYACAQRQTPMSRARRRRNPESGLARRTTSREEARRDHDWSPRQRKLIAAALSARLGSQSNRLRLTARRDQTASTITTFARSGTNGERTDVDDRHR